MLFIALTLQPVPAFSGVLGEQILSRVHIRLAHWVGVGFSPWVMLEKQSSFALKELVLLTVALFCARYSRSEDHSTAASPQKH